MLFDVSNHGIVGDGSDEVAAIQALFDYVSVSGGGRIWFHNKVYGVGSLLKAKSGCIIDGAPGATLRYTDNHTGRYYLLGIVGQQDVTVRGLTIDTNYDRPNYNISNPATPDIGIYIGRNSKNIHIENNHLITCGVWSILAEVNSTYTNNENIWVENNTINYRVGKNTLTPTSPDTFTVDTTQIYIDAKNYWINNNTITTTETGAETAIELHRRNGTCLYNKIHGFRNGIITMPGEYAEDSEAANMIVEHNTLEAVRKGINLWQDGHRDLDYVTIAHNKVEIDIDRFPLVNEAKGIFVLATIPTNNNGKKLKNISIHHNTISYLPTTIVKADPDFTVEFVGISMRGWVSLENIDISNNKIINAPATAILLGASANNTYTNSVISATVQHNTIINAGINQNMATAGNNPRAAIRVQGGVGSLVSNVVVDQNIIFDTKGSGTYFTVPIYSSAYASDTCRIGPNTIIADGY